MQQFIEGTSLRVRYGLVLLLLVCTLSPIQAQDASQTDAETVTRLLRDAVYNHELSTEEIHLLHGEIMKRIETELSDPAENMRGKVLTHYYLGRWHQAIKTRPEMVAYAERLRAERLLSLRKFYTESDQAMDAYRDARRECESLMEIRPDAEAHRLYGEILGQMLFLGDVGDLMSIGGKARKNVKEALELDPHHVKAMIQEASRLAYTPISYGGNPDKAREAYRAIFRENIQDPEDLFNIYGGFAMAAFAEHEDEEALSWFEEASAIFPGNIFAAGMADYLRGATE